MLITHDVYLAEATADQLWLVKDGKATRYDGDLQDYRALVLRADRDQDAPKTKANEPSPASATDTRARAATVDKAAQRRRSSAARKAAQPFKDKAKKAEREMAEATKRIEDIDADLAKSGLSSEALQDLMRERANLATNLEQAETDWLEATEAYEDMLNAG